MKKLLSFIAVTFLVGALAGCYNDSELKGKLDGYESRIAAMESSVKTLSSYQSLITKLEEGKMVTMYSSNSDGSYTLTFSDGSDITFNLKGEKGEDGDPAADGATGLTGNPGKNGEPGKDGITPRFRINVNESAGTATWMVSYDEGSSWKELGSAMDDSLVSAIAEDEAAGVINITLADGSQLAVPIASQFGIKLSEPSVAFFGGEPYTVSYEITGAPESSSVFVKCNNYLVYPVVEQTDATHGTITLYSEPRVGKGEMAVWASDGSKTVMAVLDYRVKQFFNIRNSMYESGTITFTKNGSPDDIKLKVKVNKDGEWSEVRTLSETTTFEIPGFGSLYFDGSENSTFNTDDLNYWSISGTIPHEARGDLMTLAGAAESIGPYMFCKLFYGDTYIFSALELVLPDEAPEGCYSAMFTGCTDFEYSPELPATKLASACYQNMFSGCESLIRIKCLATDISAEECVKDMLSGVSSSGTFICAPAMTSGWRSSNAAIPADWDFFETK